MDLQVLLDHEDQQAPVLVVGVNLAHQDPLDQRVRLDLQVLQDMLAQLDLKVLLEQMGMACQDQLDPKESGDLQAHQVMVDQERKETLAPEVTQDQLVSMEPRESQVHHQLFQASLVVLDLKVIEVHQEHLVMLDPRENQEHQAMVDLVPREMQELLAGLVYLELKVNVVQLTLENLVFPVKMVYQDTMVPKENQAMGSLDPRESLARQVTLVHLELANQDYPDLQESKDLKVTEGHLAQESQVFQEKRVIADIQDQLDQQGQEDILAQRVSQVLMAMEHLVQRVNMVHQDQLGNQELHMLGPREMLGYQDQQAFQELKEIVDTLVLTAMFQVKREILVTVAHQDHLDILELRESLEHPAHQDMEHLVLRVMQDFLAIMEPMAPRGNLVWDMLDPKVMLVPQVPLVHLVPKETLDMADQELMVPQDQKDQLDMVQRVNQAHQAMVYQDQKVIKVHPDPLAIQDPQQSLQPIRGGNKHLIVCKPVHILELPALTNMHKLHLCASEIICLSQL